MDSVAPFVRGIDVVSLPPGLPGQIIRQGEPYGVKHRFQFLLGHLLRQALLRLSHDVGGQEPERLPFALHVIVDESIGIPPSQKQFAWAVGSSVRRVF